MVLIQPGHDPITGPRFAGGGDTAFLPPPLLERFDPEEICDIGRSGGRLYPGHCLRLTLRRRRRLRRCLIGEGPVDALDADALIEAHRLGVKVEVDVSLLPVLAGELLFGVVLAVVDEQPLRDARRIDHLLS